MFQALGSTIFYAKDLKFKTDFKTLRVQKPFKRKIQSDNGTNEMNQILKVKIKLIKN